MIFFTFPFRVPPPNQTFCLNERRLFYYHCSPCWFILCLADRHCSAGDSAEQCASVARRRLQPQLTAELDHRRSLVGDGLGRLARLHVTWGRLRLGECRPSLRPSSRGRPRNSTFFVALTCRRSLSTSLLLRKWTAEAKYWRAACTRWECTIKNSKSPIITILN